jgi:hypothetical protein
MVLTFGLGQMDAGQEFPHVLQGVYANGVEQPAACNLWMNWSPAPGSGMNGRFTSFQVNGCAEQDGSSWYPGGKTGCWLQHPLQLTRAPIRASETVRACANELMAVCFS